MESRLDKIEDNAEQLRKQVDQFSKEMKEFRDEYRVLREEREKSFENFKNDIRAVNGLADGDNGLGKISKSFDRLPTIGFVVFWLGFVPLAAVVVGLLIIS